ncbi:MAG: hypothetical protein KDK63_03325 [Chlamydiia bacterium]|nr:hypothetical protein [Chlamydiia bacterium]MCB1115432.1 hypothetical protein [Chlamydiia bacterium]
MEPTGESQDFYSNFYTDTHGCYRPGDLSESQESLIELAHSKAQLGDYDQTVTLITNLLESIDNPADYYFLVRSDLFEDEEGPFGQVLNLLFQNSWEQFQTLLPVLKRHLTCEVIDRNYVSISYNHPVLTLHDNGFILRRDLTGLSFDEGMEILSKHPYKTDSDLDWLYLKFAQENHPSRVEECIKILQNRIKNENIPLDPCSDDEIIDYYINQAETFPEQKSEWLTKAEKYLEFIASKSYRYHRVAVKLAECYENIGDKEGVKRMKTLIHQNIENESDERYRRMLITVLSTYQLARK